MSDKSRDTVFWTSTGVLFFGLWLIVGVGAALAERLGLAPNIGGKIGIAFGPICVISAYGATLVCRGLRISAESTTREILTQPVQVDISEPLEVRTDPKRWQVLAFAYLIPVVLFAVLVRISAPLHLRDAWMVVAGAVSVAICGFGMFKAIFPGPPIVRLHSNTIFKGLWHRTITWDQVRRCEIITVRTVFGDVARITFVLYDEGNSVLMKSAFVPPIHPDEKRLFNALRSRFAHVEVTSKPQVPAVKSVRS